MHDDTEQKMADTVSRFVEALKKRLANNKVNYVDHYSMLGTTESGFYSTDEFDFDSLMKEIDQFSAEFKAGKTNI
jgi:hypothetical protein